MGFGANINGSVAYISTFQSFIASISKYSWILYIALLYNNY